MTGNEDMRVIRERLASVEQTNRLLIQTRLYDRHRVYAIADRLRDAVIEANTEFYIPDSLLALCYEYQEAKERSGDDREGAGGERDNE